jgi:hypothetical protein
VAVIAVDDVRLILEHKLLIFSDMIQLAAYGRSGLAWRSPRVCWDEIKIVSITSETIEGVGYDPTHSITHESRFVIDLKTGRSLLPPPTSNDGNPIWQPQVLSNAVHGKILDEYRFSASLPLTSRVVVPGRALPYTQSL